MMMMIDGAHALRRLAVLPFGISFTLLHLQHRGYRKKKRKKTFFHITKHNLDADAHQRDRRDTIYLLKIRRASRCMTNLISNQAIQFDPHVKHVKVITCNQSAVQYTSENLFDIVWCVGRVNFLHCAESFQISDLWPKLESFCYCSHGDAPMKLLNPFAHVQMYFPQSRC